jgi:glycosyltransferase involved in cell wall biosynthesis
MKILFAAHWWLPDHAAGAEVYAHALMRSLVDRGHEVKVLESRDPKKRESREPYTYDGVTVIPRARDEEEAKLQLPDLLPWADVLFGHLENTARAAVLARWANKPCWIINHNDHVNTETWALERDLYYIDNSSWMSERFGRRQSVTVHPPIDPDKWVTRATPGEHITLINLNTDKGSETFYEVARRLPDVQFLGIQGYHGDQHIPKDLPSNVEIFGSVAHSEMPDVYGHTRILMMPSAYESWGQAADEAMASGVPVLYSAPDSVKLADPYFAFGSGSTYGLAENVGSGGFACASVDQYVDAIKFLSDGRRYKKHSRLAVQRARELWVQSQRDLEEFVHAVESWM